MRWFKLHTEARNDAKLNSLTDAQFRIWFRLLCYAAEQETRGTINVTRCNANVTPCNANGRDTDVGLDDELLSIEVAGGDTDALKDTVERLKKLRIIRVDEEGLTFINFAKRQYDKPSDHPERVKERVKRHRKTKCNANVTPCNAVKRLDTDTETDTEQKQKENIPYAEIIDHLNLKAGTSYKASSKATQRHIHARWEEGYRLEDFCKVIDTKVAEWSGDPKMRKFIRPETLFGPKFESYLNQPARGIPRAFASIQSWVGDDQ